jgi:uncharacterized membrane protein
MNAPSTRSLDNPAVGRYVMVAIMLLASALRFFQLDAQSMWFDEAARLLIAQTDVASIVRETGGDTLPPLHHLILHFWGLAGDQDFWLRLPSVAFGLLLVAVVFTLGKCLFGTKTGLISALIMAVMPYQVYQSQQANLYSLLVLLSALQILFFWRAMQGGRRLWFAIFAFFAAAGMYVHYFSGLVTLAVHVWLVLVGLIEAGRHYRRRWSSLIAADAFIILLALPVVAYFLRSVGDVGGTFWLERPNLAAPLSTVYLFTLSYSLSGIWAVAGFALTSMVVALVLLELAYAYRREADERPALLLLLILAFLPILLIFVVSQAVPLYLSRTLIITTPAYALLMGRALATTRLRSPVPYLSGGILVLIIVSLYGYYFVSDFSKPDYRSAAGYVTEHIKLGQALVHSSNGSYVPFLLYYGPEDHYLIDGDPAPHHPPRVHEAVGGQTVSRDELAKWSSIWLIVAFDHSIPYQVDLLAEFDATYPILDENVIDGIVVRHYDLTGE